MQSDAVVQIVKADGFFLLQPLQDQSADKQFGIVFFPGALVEPTAYAPLLRAVAEEGYPVALIRVPRRGVFGGAEKPIVFERASAAIADVDNLTGWVIAGHSRGGEIAVRFVDTGNSNIAGLALLGTSHPTRIDLSGLTIPVTKILGSNDCVSPPERSAQYRSLLPEHRRLVMIAGGNHAQFGYYGDQLGDCEASISREDQQRQTLQAILQQLDQLSGSGDTL